MTIIYTGGGSIDQTGNKALFQSLSTRSGISEQTLRIMADRYKFDPDRVDPGCICFVKSSVELFAGRQYSIGDVIEAAYQFGAVVAEFEYLLAYFTSVSVPLWRRLYAFGSTYRVAHSGINLYPYAWTYPEYLSLVYTRNIASASKESIQKRKFVPEYFLFRSK